jgi:hypothetical protein
MNLLLYAHFPNNFSRANYLILDNNTLFDYLLYLRLN